LYLKLLISRVRAYEHFAKYFFLLFSFPTAHIFFDDAFEISDDNDDENVVNRFVKLLVATIDEAASLVHETEIHVKPPKKYPTPYGGRLVWTLPGKTKMIAHLKDKSKIRHRKRWSQVRLSVVSDVPPNF
jgi:chitin synthase